MPFASIPDQGPIQAVCLDLDDTLLDTEFAARQALRDLVGNDGAWPVWDRITEQLYEHYLAGEQSFEFTCIERTRAFFAAFGENITWSEADRREAARMAAMRRAWRLFDDSEPCLRRLRDRGLRLAIITNAPGASQRGKIEAMGLADSFDTLVISGELGIAKPDPRIFHTACTRLDLRPDQVAHVGDRLDVDAVAAAAAGLRGIWLNRKGAGRPCPADITTIDNLTALPDLVASRIANGSGVDATAAPPMVYHLPRHGGRPSGGDPEDPLSVPAGGVWCNRQHD